MSATPPLRWKRRYRKPDSPKSHVKAVRAKLNVTSRTEAVAVAQRRGLLPKGIAIRRPGPAADEKGYPAAPLIVHQQPSVARVWSEMTAAVKSQTRPIA
jgi:hypothetical protein